MHIANKDPGMEKRQLRKTIDSDKTTMYPSQAATSGYYYNNAPTLRTQQSATAARNNNNTGGFLATLTQPFKTAPWRLIVSQLWTLVTILLAIAIVCAIIYIAIKPSPVKYLIRKMRPCAEYTADKTVATITPKHTFYTQPNSTHQKLIVVIMGGSGMFSNLKAIYGLTNWLFARLGNTYDLVTFQYPTRFEHTIHDAMLSINKSLMDFIHYPVVDVVAVSFGVLLAGAFYQKEASLIKSKEMQVPQIGIRFRSMVALCGLFDLRFSSSLIETLVKHYIMKHVPGKYLYSCYGIDIPKLVVSARSDFLVAQTIRFCQSETNLDYKIFESNYLPHAFCQFINMPEAEETLETTAKFLENLDAKQTATTTTAPPTTTTPTTTTTTAPATTSTTTAPTATAPTTTAAPEPTATDPSTSSGQNERLI